MKQIQWIVQRNLIKDEQLTAFKQAVNNDVAIYQEVDVIPFSTELPIMDKTIPAIIYGSINFNNLCLQDKELNKGIFFNDNFNMETYFKYYKENMLNYDSKVMTIGELLESINRTSDTTIFIRPVSDTKEFDGLTLSYKDIDEWFSNALVFENTGISKDTKIVVAAPYRLKYEWRLVIVNGKVIAGSKYRTYFNLTKEEGYPIEVKEYAERMCQIYTPHNVFIMDICLCGDSYYIIECGCFNGAGFYNSNMNDIIREVSNYFKSTI